MKTGHTSWARAISSASKNSRTAASTTSSFCRRTRRALPDALDAIAAADLILLGPGSLYTSIIPNLLVDGVAEAIAASDAQKIYVCNIMTQDGETEGYTAADHLAALLRHGTADMVELCLANSSPIPPELAERYRAEGAEALTIDRERIAQMGIELVERPLASPSGDFARHDPDALASAVLDIYRARAVPHLRRKGKLPHRKITELPGAGLPMRRSRSACRQEKFCRPRKKACKGGGSMLWYSCKPPVRFFKRILVRAP